LACIFFSVNNKDHIAVNNSLCQPIEFTRDDDTPECWDSKQAKYFCEEYPWLYFKNKKLGCNICHKVNLSLNKNQVSRDGQFPGTLFVGNSWKGIPRNSREHAGIYGNLK